MEVLRSDLNKYGQQHLLQFWDQLNGEQQECLKNDISSIDLREVTSAYQETINQTCNGVQKLDDLLEPIPKENHGSVSGTSKAELKEYRNEGLNQIGSGRVAVLLLAGGQGTRLGVNYPKGMYDVGLPSHKTLYQLQGERILKLQQLAYEKTGRRGTIPWYIMTSEHTVEPTIEFFAQHNYFGLKSDDIVVFEQNMHPCFDFEGRIILEKPWKISKAPDGNGGLFQSLKQRGILDDMTRRGIYHIHVYCVDNILVKMADPVFIGYCVRKNANCAVKVVEKVVPTEAVGVVCRVNGKYQVVEYSEVSLETAQKRNSDGKLTFNAGNICNHYFSLDFLKTVANEKNLKHHIAKKKITYVDENGFIVKPTKPNGIKLEKFVFDVFEFSDRFVAWEVLREEEFSPLKNGEDAKADSPTTARQALLQLHKRYVMRAGGKFEERLELMSNENGSPKDNIICEISPLVSYDGEGLEDLVCGKTFVSPLIIRSTEEQTILETVANGHRQD
uniref:UDP-N-acetylglucosamine diphosphorylase n=1 Tax=Hadrurus spadix TaxID=141984 RepID=A0A1W7R9C3_9SCOR